MQRESSRDILKKTSWRGITYNYDILSTFGEQRKLYCLSDFQVAWLLSNTEYMGWATRWENSPLTSSELSNMKAELEYSLMSCIDINAYQVQELYDSNQNAQRAVYQQLYDEGGIPALNPDTPTDFYDGDGSDERIDALCMAVDTYVRSYVVDWVNKAQLAQTALNFSAFVVSFVPYIGKVTALALKGLAIISQVAIDAMNDSGAVDDVVCCMKSYLEGSAVNELNFENSLSSCGFAIGSNASIVRDIVASDLDGFQNWLTFLNALGDSYVWIQAGVDYICPCSDGTWETVFDFTIGDGGWIGQANRSQYTVGVGWQSFNFDANASGLYMDYPNLPLNTVTEVILEGYWTGQPDTSFSNQVLYSRDASQQLVEEINDLPIPTPLNDKDLVKTFDNYGLRITTYFVRNVLFPVPQWTNTKMTIRGIGESPFT